MSKQPVLFTQNIDESVDNILSQYTYDKLFVLTDRNTFKFASPLLANSQLCKDAKQIVIEADDTHKNLESLASVWQTLSDDAPRRQHQHLSVPSHLVVQVTVGSHNRIEMLIICIGHHQRIYAPDRP